MPGEANIMTCSDHVLQQDPQSHGLWAKSAPALSLRSSEPLARDIDADVVVVGAGFTGLAAALRLAEKGASAVVLEARAIGYGASGRNVGLVNAGLWLSPEEVVNRLGADHGERLIKALGDAPNRVFDLIEAYGIGCEANRTGTLHCAHSKAGLEDLRRRAKKWSALGAPIELLNKNATALKLGTECFHGALLDHRTGTIQPLGYVRGLARAAADAGVRIYTHAPARGLSRNGERWRVATDSGSATGKLVIVATNAYTQDILPIPGCIVPFSFFQLSTPPLSPDTRETILPGGHGAWDTAKILTSFRLDSEGRLIVGSIGRLDPQCRGIHASWMRRKIRRMFPQLNTVTFEHGWQGTIATTPDHLPRISQPFPGVITAYGYNGRGIGPGTVFGEAMADFCLSGNTGDLPLPVTTMNAEPFSALRAIGIELGVKASHWVSNRL